MTTISKVEQAETERKWVLFWRQHPTFCHQANRSVMEDYLDKNMLSVASDSGQESLEIAFLACHSRLSERQPEKEPAPRPQAKQQEDQPFVVKNEQGKTVYNEYWTKERLRAAINQETRTVEQPVPVLPDEYTAKRLKQMSAAEIRNLTKDIAVESGLGPGSERLVMIGITNRLQGRN